MGREDRLELVRDSLRKLVLGPRTGELDRRRRRSVTTPASVPAATGRPTRRPSSAPSTELQPGGSTNLEAGLRLGYSLARETMHEDGIDRIVARVRTASPTSA